MPGVVCLAWLVCRGLPGVPEGGWCAGGSGAWLVCLVLPGVPGRPWGRAPGRRPYVVVREAASAAARAATCAVRTASTAWAAFAAMSVRCWLPSSRMRPTAR